MTAQEQQAMDGFTRSSSFTFCLDTWIHPHFLARIPPERQVQHARMRSTMIVSIPTRSEKRVQRRDFDADDIAGAVSIPARPSGRVQPRSSIRAASTALRFNPRPPLGAGATAENLRKSRQCAPDFLLPP